MSLPAWEDIVLCDKVKDAIRICAIAEIPLLIVCESGYGRSMWEDAVKEITRTLGGAHLYIEIGDVRPTLPRVGVNLDPKEFWREITTNQEAEKFSAFIKSIRKGRKVFSKMDTKGGYPPDFCQSVANAIGTRMSFSTPKNIKRLVAIAHAYAALEGESHASRKHVEEALNLFQ